MYIEKRRRRRRQRRNSAHMYSNVYSFNIIRMCVFILGLLASLLACCSLFELQVTISSTVACSYSYNNNNNKKLTTP